MRPREVPVGVPRDAAGHALSRLFETADDLDASIAWGELVRAWPWLSADDRADLRERALAAPPRAHAHALRVMRLE